MAPQIQSWGGRIRPRGAGSDQGGQTGSGLEHGGEVATIEGLDVHIGLSDSITTLSPLGSLSPSNLIQDTILPLVIVNESAGMKNSGSWSGCGPRPIWGRRQGDADWSLVIEERKEMLRRDAMYGSILRGFDKTLRSGSEGVRLRMAGFERGWHQS